MKVPAALITLALATAVVAQDLPSCAQGCANQYLRGGIGNCGTEASCICANKEFIDSIACCLVGVCDDAAQTLAIGYASSLCSAFGVTTLPTAVQCSTVKPTGASTTRPADTTAPATGGASSGTTPPATGTTAETVETGSAAGGNKASSSKSTNFGPRPTAAAGLGAIGGIVAAMALL